MTVKIEVHCPMQSCLKYEECGAQEIELEEPEYKEGLDKSVQEGEPGGIYLEKCPRYGPLNTIFFVLVKVNGVFTEQFLERTRTEISIHESNLVVEKEKYEQRVEYLQQQIEAKKKILESSG